MILPPSGGIGHIHLVAEHIPYDTRLNPRIKRFIYCHRLQPRQPLVSGDTTAVDPSKYFFKQFPKLTFTH